MAGVLLKKQEKMSQKGSKYAFLQMSDPSGIFEVTIFSETLNAARDFLVAGESLLLKVEVEKRDDQMRMTAGSIQPLEQALEGKIHEIQIHLQTPDAAPKIRQFLDIEGKGRSKITLFAHLGDKRIARINLGGYWSLSAQARNIIRAEQGVLKISEL